MRVGWLSAKMALLGPGLLGFAFLKTTAYTDKDLEERLLTFFQPVPNQTGRFKNDPGQPETNFTKMKGLPYFTVIISKILGGCFYKIFQFNHPIII